MIGRADQEGKIIGEIFANVTFDKNAHDGRGAFKARMISVHEGREQRAYDEARAGHDFNNASRQGSFRTEEQLVERIAELSRTGDSAVESTIEQMTRAIEAIHNAKTGRAEALLKHKQRMST